MMSPKGDSIIEAEGLLGREREVAAVVRFLDAIQKRPAAAALEGDAGIGKTALFRAAAGEARRRGYTILSAMPTRAESALSFVGLTDLLADAHGLFAALPAPQRRALEVALLLEDVDGAPPDPRAIGLGLLGVLRALADSSPVIVAIDDLQWLDAASAAPLAFALRRLTNEPIGLLAALRMQGDAPTGELLRGIEAEHIPLGPLSVGALHALLGERLQLSIPRSLLLRIHEACRGNPLYALELGRGLQERGLPEPGQPFEVPADAESLFAARLEQLSDATLDALAVAAAIAAPTRSLVDSASAGDLEPAARAGVIYVEGDRVHFTHPLLATAVYARLEPESRRGLHRRLSEASSGEERARHLALAAEGPDASVAAALDEASEQAARRGAPIAAADLAGLAVQLTPATDRSALRTRKRVAADRHVSAGDIGRARGILESLVDELPPGAERARALESLAYTHTGEQLAMLRLRERAAVEAVGDDRVLAAILRSLALNLFVTGDPVQALARAREALAAAERVGDLRLRVPNMAFLSWMEVWAGRLTRGLLERAIDLEPQAGYLRLYESPAIVDGLRLMVLADDLDAARTRLCAAERRAQEHGYDIDRAVLLGHLAELEYRAGRLDDAAGCATEAYDLREQFGLSPSAFLYYLALIELARGHPQEAKAAAERGLELSEEAGYEVFVVRNLLALGLVASVSGDAESAARILAPLPERLAARGYGCANLLQVQPDAVEALIAVGELDAAATQLEELEETARAIGTAYARARTDRCRGLLAAARRDHEAALAAFADALAAHDQRADPLERGRTLLALGQTQRRAGRRRDARDALQQAFDVFEDIGAAPWVERARDELDHLGGRTPSERELTGAEERVARLVAEGKTNREVAAALFVTERTVETHLSSIYRKLELRSRSELVRRLAGDPSS